MPVLAFRSPREPHPVLVNIFCVQRYWRNRSSLAEGKLDQFGSMELALRAGREAARHAPLVHIYRVRGNVEADYWEEPVTIARLGELAS